MTKKLTFKELSDQTDNWEEAVIVFTEGSFKNEYTKEQRSYKVKSDAKYFRIAGGNSLFADCLDGTDQQIRLDHYLGDWTIDHCYITKSK